MIRGRLRTDVRRRNPALFAALVLVAVLFGLDYAAGLLSDEVEIVDRTSPGIATATLDACGATVPFKPALIGRHRWRATPARLCAGMTGVAIRLRDGTVDRCTAFSVRPKQDWRVVVTDSGCGGFVATALPAL